MSDVICQSFPFDLNKVHKMFKVVFLREEKITR